MKIALVAVLALGVGAILGMLGGGGAILMTPILRYVIGLDAKRAILGSLFVVGATSAVGAVTHWRRGNVRPRTGLVFGLAGMIGAYTGGRATHLVDGSVLLVLFSTVMIASAATMLRKRAKKEGDDKDAPSREQYAKIALIGVGVGLLSGFVGAGGGFLIVPALVLFGGVPMRQAVGTSLLVIAMQSTAGILGQITHTPMEWRVVSVAAGGAVLGSFVGAALGQRIAAATLRRGFAALVLLVGAVILAREGFRLYTG